MKSVNAIQEVQVLPRVKVGHQPGSRTRCRRKRRSEAEGGESSRFVSSLESVQGLEKGAFYFFVSMQITQQSRMSPFTQSSVTYSPTTLLTPSGRAGSFSTRQADRRMESRIPLPARPGSAGHLKRCELNAMRSPVVGAR
jgi:hypothetical protein